MRRNIETTVRGNIDSGATLHEVHGDHPRECSVGAVSVELGYGSAFLCHSWVTFYIFMVT